MKEEIVIPAWELASKHSGLKIFNFIPSVIATIYLALILLYQSAWTYIHIFNKKDEFLKEIVNFVHTDNLIPLLFMVGIGILMYLFILPIGQGGLVALIHRESSFREQGQEGAKGGIGFAIGQGIRHFLPIFEANNLVALFKLISIITFSLFLVRIIGQEYVVEISMAMGGYFLLALFMNAFLSYTKYFIVLENKTAFSAMIASANMTIAHLGTTFSLYGSVLLVYLRTLLTALILIVLPFGVSAILTYVTTSEIQIVMFSILGALVFGLLLFISHLTSVLDIFAEALWYRTYKQNKEKEAYLEKTLGIHLSGDETHDGHDAHDTGHSPTQTHH